MKMFISYRRDDTRWVAGRLQEKAAAAQGGESVFMDTEGIRPGVNFRESIRAQLVVSTVVVALIGKDWSGLLSRKTETTPFWLRTFGLPGIAGPMVLPKYRTAEHHRIQQSDDMVRYELEQALELQKRIIPIFVEGAEFPKMAVPLPLRALADLQSMKIDHASFAMVSDQLIREVFS